MSMRRPRQEVARCDRTGQFTVREGGGGHGGGQLRRRREDGRRRDAQSVHGGEDDPRRARPIPPAPPFDGSGLERCAEKGGFVLGRDAYLVDAVLTDASVSYRHARLTQRHGEFYIEDLNSANGTWINGRRIEQCVPTPLGRGNAVTLGTLDVALWPHPAARESRRP